MERDQGGDQRHEQDALQTLLRQTRQEAGLRQRDLAALLGVPQSFVSKVETGERRLDVLELRRVCRALGLPLAAFVARLEEALVGSGGTRDAGSKPTR